jgi:beta-lactamase class A
MTIRLVILLVLCSQMISTAALKPAVTHGGDDSPAIENLRRQIASIAPTAQGQVGVAIMHLESRDTVSVNGGLCLPMQSVYKFPLALSVLDRVDRGELQLQQKIHISPKDLLPGTWSPLRDRYPEGNIDLPLSELVFRTVAQSDNNGCDILFRLMGGTDIVNRYIHGLGVSGIAMVATEEEMHTDEKIQYSNWCEPRAMLQLLDLFFSGKILSDSSSAFLMKTMIDTQTGPRRIKGLLPEGTMVAHKTGSSGIGKSGMTAATNDVGIVTLPDGSHFAIAVFVADARANEETIEAVIAKISRAAWDYFLTKRK